MSVSPGCGEDCGLCPPCLTRLPVHLVELMARSKDTVPAVYETAVKCAGMWLRAHQPVLRAPTHTEGLRDMDWRHRAACRDEAPDLFYPVGNSGPALQQISEAKAVCRRCPVAADCLDWALASKQEWGVWGGMSEDERRGLTRDAARSRAAAAAAARREAERRRAEVVGDICGGKITAHVRTPENTHVTSRGQVRCRDCDRDTQSRKRARRRGLSERGAA